MGIGSANPLLLSSASAATDDSDPVTRSLRFDFSSNCSVYRTFSSAGDQQEFTFSAWVKRSHIPSEGYSDYIFTWGDTYWDYLYFHADGTLRLSASSGSDRAAQTTSVFRDTSAWLHVALVVDGTQSSNADCVKIFVNGEQQSLTFSGTTFVSNDFIGFNTANEARFGRGPFTSNWSGLYIADPYFIDGSAVTPVGNFIQDTGYNSYKPKSYNMSSHGGNSFHLKFEDSSDIGADSANSNDFSTSNLSSHDVMLDVPTNNYAVLNPLDPDGSSNTFSEGNLKCVVSSQNTSEESPATIGISSGKWYWEQYVVSSSNGGYLKVGVKSDTGSKYWHVRGSDGETESDTGSGASNGSSSVSYSATNIVGVAVDMDAGKWWVSVDGTFVGSPTAGTGELHSGLSGTVLPYVLNASSSSGSHTIVCNFGQDPTFAGNKTSGQDTSQSEFYYAPPSGFKSLNTGNFDDPTVKAHENFGVATWSGNSSSQEISDYSFQPNFAWIKNRNYTYTHGLFDSVRGGSKVLQSSATSNEVSSSSYLTSFDDDGFTMGSNPITNESSYTYVGWSWKENASAGFDIVTWTGDSSSSGDYSTVSHSLGVAPEMIIAKSRTGYANTYGYGEKDWVVYHKDLGNGSYGYQKYLLLNETDAAVQGGYNGSASPIDNVGSSNFRAYNEGSYDSGEDQYMNFAYSGTGDNYVAYLFASVDGVCKVGSYTGNSSADGPMVHCGFRPAFVILKRVANSDGWVMHDSGRDTDNGVQLILQADTAADELGSGTDSMDFLATGFKLKVASTARNNSGEKYIFLAMAESPLKYANAR